MRTLQLLPLLAAIGVVACGEGEVGAPPGDSFDDHRPYIYSEQPDKPGEKPVGARDPALGVAETKPLPSPFGLDSEGLPGDTTPVPTQGPPPQGNCDYYSDGCAMCSGYSECLGCWQDSSTADLACSSLFQQSGGDCDYASDACYYCGSYSECLGCWPDSSTADLACSTMFP